MARLGKSNSAAKPLLLGAGIILLLAAGVYFATAPRTTPEVSPFALTPTPAAEGGSPGETPSATEAAALLQTPLPEIPRDATPTPAPDAVATPTVAPNSTVSATPSPDATGVVPVPEVTLVPEVQVTPIPTTAAAPSTTSATPGAGY